MHVSKIVRYIMMEPFNLVFSQSTNEYDNLEVMSPTPNSLCLWVWVCWVGNERYYTSKMATKNNSSIFQNKLKEQK